MPKTLLLADDSVVIQKLVGLSFANEDVKLITTDNGDDAIAKAREHKPDLVLADVVMPGKSGYEVCEAIKADPELAHIPVILLTGTFEAFDEARSNVAGSSGHITKPFEAQALVDRVNNLLRESAKTPSASPTVDEDFEIFDGGSARREDSLGHDVTRAASSPAQPDAHDPLAADSGYDIGGAGNDLPPLTDGDPLATPLDLCATLQPIPSDMSFSGIPEVADDDLLATPAREVQHSPTVDSLAFEASDATPALDDSIPPPIPILGEPVAPLGAFDSAASNSDPSDPSLTTVIMSDGGTSSDHIAFGEHEAPVRSLDELSDEPSVEAETMLADDLFDEPAPSFDSDSSFDFGSSSAPAHVFTPTPATDSNSPLNPEPISVSPRHAAPEVARRYDVSSSELIDPLDSGSVFDEPDSNGIETETSADEIALTDGLLGAPFDPDGNAPEARSEPPAHDEDAATGTGPDITPVMRDRIHETLERVAWEAFADLPDTLIKQVVERVEAIAWEVIPQMAEALIKEEIRRIKGEDE